MQPLIYGLDFGTSNSAISVLRGNDATILPIGWNGGRTIRSVVYFPEGRSKHVYVGEEGIHEYLDHDMHGRFLQSVKTLLPDPSFEGTIIRGWGMQTAERLVAHVIGYLRLKANELVGEDVTRVVMGRPVNFSDDPVKEALAHRRLIEAARIAGFEQIEMQLEPIAAAYDYERSIKAEETVLVADLGGGTTDFTIMRLSPARRGQTNRQDDLLGSAGVYIGGDKFDSLIMRRRLLKYFAEGSSYDSAGKRLPMPQHLLLDLCRWQRIPFLRDPRIQETIGYLLLHSDDRAGIRRLKELVDRNLGFQLFRSIERAKIALTDEVQAKIRFHHSNIQIDEDLNRDEFDSIIAREIAVLDQCVSGLLEVKGITVGQIDTVFITGGSSMIPAIRHFLGQKFGHEKIRTGDTFTSVAAGLALSALH